MKSIHTIRQEILQGMRLDSPELTVQSLTEVFKMPSFFHDGHIHLIEEVLQFSPDAFSQTMQHVVNRASKEELLENYQLLTGQSWEWVEIQDEPDCHPESFLRNKTD